MRAVSGVVMLAVAVAAPVSAQSVPAPPVNRTELRHQIYVMEGALARAVEFGAQRLNQELRAVAPDMFLLSGDASARGVHLEGYGVFFDVEVPMLRESMMWSLRMMLEQDDTTTKAAVADLRRFVQSVTDPAARASLEQAIRRLEAQAMPVNMGARPGTPMPSQDPAVAPGTVLANGAPAEPRAARPPAAADRAWLKDPNRAYSEAVVRALIDAMIDFSAPMSLGDEEFLTVAARDNARRDTLAPQDPFEEVVTVLLRIRGVDLKEYRAGRIDKAEARKRVRVTEF